ncbi:MAG: hypothetical protein HDR57_02700 [Treponema sp.]|nr:hypothetical protein [Treponema sp.]
MKSIKNYLLAVLALAAILTVVSCKNEDNDPSEVASYVAKVEGVEATATATFYDNDTFRIEGGGNILEGTYKGSADKGGEITLELTKASANGQTAPEGALAGLAATFLGGNGSSKAGKGTVSNDGKKLTLGVSTYTRS